MRRYILPVLFLSISVAATAQVPERHVMRKGNKLYAQREYDGAQKAYLHGKDIDSSAYGVRFNLGDVYYKQGNHAEAEKYFGSLEKADANETQQAQLLHNLGNAQLQQKKYEESIKSYKQSLRLNPADNDTRTNLAYAQKMMEQQQNQDNNNQDNKDNSKDGKDNQDEKNDKENQDNKDNSKDRKDNQDEKNDKENQDSKQQPKISPQDAQRMLEAIQADEKNTQDKVNKEKAKAVQRQRVEKNW